MRKRVVSVALAASMVFSLFAGVSLPGKTYAASAKSSSSLRDIDEDTYGELGLSLKVDEDAAPVPYSESNATKLAAGQEIYVAANGIGNNRYTVRDGFDTINEYRYRSSDRSDEYGELDGAYDYYQDVNNSVPSYYGGTTASKISSNRTNSLANEYNGFSGIYASSVEFDGGDGKDNYIAEIRAHKKEETTVYNGKTYHGKLTLNIFKIDENGTRTQVAEYSPGLNDSSFSSNGNMMYFARRYVQELEVIFDIKKGDVNGDGLDDLFLYTGRYTDISDVRYAVIDVFYGDGNGRFTKGDDIMQSCGSSADFKTSNNWYEWVFGIPTASLATGDLDRDGKDELAVTVSTSTEHSNVAAAGHLSVFYCVNNNMAYVEGLKDIPLANPDVDGRGMAAANCTFGDFVMPDSDLAVTTLIVGGYYEGTKMNMYTPFSEGAYFYIYKNLRGKGYRISDYHVVDLGQSSRLITESYKEYMGYYNRPVHAPISMACADLDGMANGKPGDSILFGAEVYDFTIKDGLGDQIGEISLCSEQYNGVNSTSSYYANGKSQVWIGDVKVGSVDTNAADYNYRESFVCVVGVRNGTESYNTSKDYYWMDIAVFTLVDGKGYSSQEGVVARSNPRNDTYGTFISLSLPDIDDDAVIMEFEEKYVVYTNPEVYAVLEASPYFADLQEAYGYVNNGGTSYSTSTGTSSSTSAGFSQTVGVYTSAEASFFGSAEFEAEVAAGASYEYETTRTTEYEISYNAAGGGTDQVVMFCLKYMYYVYNMYIPAEKKWEKVIMPVSLGSSTSILDVEDYDKIAERTRGLSPVRDNILYNTPGFPETYGGAVYGSSVYTFPGSYSGVAASQGADQTQTITVTTEESTTWTFSLEINVKAGAGGGFLGNNAKAGVTSHTEAGFGTATANSEGMSFSGTVDNVPRDCSDFTFDWKLIVNSARLNGSGNPVWVVGYDVRGVERPPYMPMGLTVTDATKNSISLAWDPVEKVSFYELYMLDAKGNYNLKATVPYTVTDYTVKGLIPNRTYSFAVRSVDSLGAKSIHSPSATASTLQDSANFKITKHPADTSTYSGGTAEFSAGASYEDEDGISRPVGYCWQVCEDGEWKNVKRGGTVATLKLIGVSEDMDGYEYRCRVYYNDITLYTKSATLSVDKAASVAGLSLCYSDSGEIINDKDIVHATGGVSTTREETISGVDPVIVVTSDNTFVLVTDGTNYLWEDENKNYYECTATISTDGDGYIVEGTTLDSSSIGSSTLTVTEAGHKASVTSVVSDESGSSTVTKTSYALTSATPAEGEIVSYTSDSITYNVIKSKWTDSNNQYSFYLLSTSDGSSSIYYYVSNSDATKCGECSISCSYSIMLSESVTISEASLKDAKIKSSSKVNVTDDTLYSGETVQLACKPTSLSGEAITGPVKFSISGPDYELLTGTFDSTTGNYIATWVPKGEGTYTIYSVFEGNNLYKSSISTEMTVYTTFGDRKTLCLDVDSEVNYGDDVDFVLSEVNGADGKTTDITEANGIEYTVYKYNTINHSFEQAAANAYSLSGSVFIPKETGNFKLKAARNGSTVEEIINVSMAKIIISAVDTEKGINDADRSCADAVITGIKSWDRQYTPVRDVDYELQSDGVSSNILGEYTINGSIIRNEDNSYTDNIAYLSERYNLGMRSAQYTLTGNVYTVTAKTAN
ncbi:MAG: fibronectin type III domain-containing protein, partial [Coprococcus sp.]